MRRDFPLGSIQNYSGAIVDIPKTFRLCDGTLGTPDLRNKFITGAGDTYLVNAIGGAVNHNHDFSSNIHDHQIGAGTDLLAGAGNDSYLSSEIASGTTDLVNGLPPYCSLAYIMYAGKVH